jgi:hypothetical protein
MGGLGVGEIEKRDPNPDLRMIKIKIGIKL